MEPTSSITVPARRRVPHLGWWLAAAALAVVAIYLPYRRANLFLERFREEREHGWVDVEYEHPAWIDAVWGWFHEDASGSGDPRPFLPWFDRVVCKHVSVPEGADSEWFQ